MSEVWQRPLGLKFPALYYKFVTTDCKSDRLVEYKIQDIPADRHHEACEFMVKHFVSHEPKIVARNGHNDPLVVEDYYTKFMLGIKQQVSVACFKRGSNEFVAVNILEVLGRNDDNSSAGFEMKSQTCADITQAVDYVLEKSDVFNRHKVDYYLSGTALAIHSDYRGRGIAMEMIKARIPMLQFLGLTVTSTGFSSIGAQKAAARAGCAVDYSISYKDLSLIDHNWNFCGTDSENYVQMSMKL